MKFSSEAEDISQLYGVNVAMKLLRPEAKWEITNKSFTRWDDPRPCPSWEEIEETMAKIKEFEASIPTIWPNDEMKELFAAK